MKPAELLTVVAVVAVGVAWLSPTPRPFPALNLQLPAGVKVLQRQDHLALLRVDMEGHAGLDLEFQFTGPHKDSSFHLSETQSSNGAYCQLVNGRLDAYASSRFPGGDRRLLKGWPVPGPTLRLHIARGRLQGERGLNLQDPYLFSGPHLFISLNPSTSHLKLSFTP